MDFIKEYDITGGSAVIILKRNEKFEEKVSLEVLTDVGYVGTTDEISFVQSNDRDLPLTKWHPLPEPALILSSDDSHLLSTIAFTAKFIALRYVNVDGSAGKLTLTANFKN